MQRGAHEIGKMLNKGLPATGIKAGLPGNSLESRSGSGGPLVGLQGQSLQQGPALTISADWAEQQAVHDNKAARQWVPHTDDDEMNRL